jgi:hypothetical protein
LSTLKSRGYASSICSATVIRFPFPAGYSRRVSSGQLVVSRQVEGGVVVEPKGTLGVRDGRHGGGHSIEVAPGEYINLS